MLDALRIQRAAVSRRAEVDPSRLGFGDHFSDHMFSLRYRDGEWGQPEIVPLAPIPLHPGCLALHYGQSVFEGLKAFRGVDGQVRIFRADRNAARFAESCRRLCIPTLPDGAFEAAVQEIVRVEHEWIPTGRGEALYVRPLVFAEGRASSGPALVDIPPAHRHLPGQQLLRPVRGRGFAQGTGPLHPCRAGRGRIRKDGRKLRGRPFPRHGEHRGGVRPVAVARRRRAPLCRGSRPDEHLLRRRGSGGHPGPAGHDSPRRHPGERPHPAVRPRHRSGGAKDRDRRGHPAERGRDAPRGVRSGHRGGHHPRSAESASRGRCSRSTAPPPDRSAPSFTTRSSASSSASARTDTAGIASSAWNPRPPRLRTDRAEARRAHPRLNITQSWQRNHRLRGTLLPT